MKDFKPNPEYYTTDRKLKCLLREQREVSREWISCQECGFRQRNEGQTMCVERSCKGELALLGPIDYDVVEELNFDE